MARQVQLILDGVKAVTATRKFNGAYKPNKALDNRITAENRAQTKNMFQVAQEELGGTIFDIGSCTRSILSLAAVTLGELPPFNIDSGTLAMMAAVNESGIRFGMNKFLQTVF